MVGRRERILAPLGDMTGLGLEIGALHHPIVDRARFDVLYADHADTATLRTKYADDDAVGEMVDVDVVWGDRDLSEALGERHPIDWAVASHVIEHVPDIVAWLDQLAGAMRDGGVLSLAIPDKRYCFDINRRETDPAEVVGAWLEHRTRPTLAMVYDFYARIQPVDGGQAWAGAYGATPREDDAAHGVEWAQRAAATDDYVDVHCWVFTPQSFLATLRTLFRIGLTSFRVASMTPTAGGEIEFFCALERLPRALDREERTRLQLASIDALPPFDAPAAGSGLRTMLVSDKEARLIEAKRRAMKSARRVAGRNR
jgi:hypothetical protein